MGRPLFNKARREAHLNSVSERYLLGETQNQIAQALEVSPSQINYDLKKLQKRWQEAAIINFDAAKGRELAKIDALERTYWEGWERSKRPKEKSETKTQESVTAILIASVTKEERDGDPRFLDGVMRCIAKRCDILGLDAPKKTTLSGDPDHPLVLQPVRTLTVVLPGSAIELSDYSVAEEPGRNGHSD